MAQTNPPCKDCEIRRQGCHTSCEEYAEFQRALERRKKRQRQDQAISKYFYESHMNRIDFLTRKGSIK